ncbi:amino acid adenylation domain-containing protein [Advenella incenata]|uniref:Amino acid adenylation domain-containing protein n=1 Tax=Advenella incenata TaxID=267800 RepID=A0A4Q7VRG5_9BURK|nr:non-ribosomal peptide synthetase [Advenella incenata]RZT99029.1 amino acid adenylation domain-containing protein [Advenella incenata]
MSHSLHEFVLKKVSAIPDLIAVVDEQGITLTYAALYTRSTMWMQLLIKNGASTGDRIGVAVKRNTELLCILLGVLRAGCSWVPLDPAYPSKWLDFVIKDSGLKFLIQDNDQLTENQNPGYVSLSIDDIDKLNHNSIPTEISVKATDICYVIYTSGSTGVPKGVMIQHKNAVNLIEWSLTAFSRQEMSRVICSTSICFDLSIFEIFGTLAAGGTCYLVENGLSIMSLSEDTRPTLINTVPSIMREILRLNALPREKLVVNLAGEPLGIDLVNSLRGFPNVARVVNLYGPSETTTYSTYTEIQVGEDKVSIGKPIRETQIFILDKQKKMVSSGEIGEIYIAGQGVSAGYINQPALTKEKFVTLDLIDQNSILAYRTGDMARQLPDGNLEYLGRIDDQVKIRGHRIELQQIEETLLNQPHILEAAVVVAHQNQENALLVAYIVLVSNCQTDVQTMRHSIGEEMPLYMIPGRWEIRESLPKLPNGKVNRKQLRLWSENIPAQLVGNENVALTRLETLISEIILRSTGLSHLDSDVDFFSLGVNSLSALKIASLIGGAIGKTLPSSILYQFNTVNALTAFLNTIDSSGVLESEIKSTVPEITDAQRQMLFLSILTDNSPANNVAFVIHVNETYSSSYKSEKLINSLFFSSPLMRCRSTLDGEWVYIEEKPAVDYYIGDFSGAEVEAITLRASQKNIDPTESSLWRLTVVLNKCAPTLLIFNFHHLLIDEISLNLLVEIVRKSLTNNERIRLPVMEFGKTKRSVQDEHDNRKWWLKNLNKLDSHFLTKLQPLMIDNVTDTRSLRSSSHIIGKNYETLVSICQKYNVTLYEFMLSLAARILSDWLGAQAISIGTIMSVRHKEELPTGVGFYGNLVPLLIQHQSSMSREEFLLEVVRTVKDANRHSSVSSTWLQLELQKRMNQKNTLPIMYGCIRALDDMAGDAIAKVTEVNVQHSHSLLNFQVRYSEKEIVLFIDGNEDAFNQNTLDDLLNNWVSKLMETVMVFEGAEIYE